MVKHPSIYERPETDEIFFGPKQLLCTSPDGAETAVWKEDDDFILIKD